jgi:hypothetical protein
MTLESQDPLLSIEPSFLWLIHLEPGIDLDCETNSSPKRGKGPDGVNRRTYGLITVISEWSIV